MNKRRRKRDRVRTQGLGTPSGSTQTTPPGGVGILEFREETEAHRRFIAATPAGVVRASVWVLKTVYNHHKAILRGPDDPWQTIAHSTKTRSFNPQYVHYEFYKSHYRPVGHVLDGAGKKVLIEEFNDMALLAPLNGTKNTISFLQGHVGSGKSTLLNYLIGKYAKQWWDSGRWFVRVNLQHQALSAAIPRSVEPLTTQDGRRFGMSAIVKAIALKAIRIVRQTKEFSDPAKQARIAPSIEELLEKVAGAELVDALATFFERVELVYEKVPILFLDNLDFLVHQLDRGLFSQNGTKDLTSMVAELAEFVGHVSPGHESRLSGMKANIVLFMRPQTAELVESMSPRPHLETNPDRRAYELPSVDWQTVLTSRKSLISALTKAALADGEAALAKQLESVAFDAANPKVDQVFSLLSPLTNYGHRDLAQHVSEMMTVPDATDWTSVEQLRSRLLEQGPITLLTFLLGRRCLYSERHAGFPNLFSCHAGEVPERERHSEKTSYWLRFLVLAIVERLSKTGQDSRPSKVFKLLSGVEKKGRNIHEWYSMRLVQDALGSLSVAAGANLLEPQRAVATADDGTLDVRIQGLHLTKRAETAMEKVFGKFCYLELISDDPALGLPPTLAAAIPRTENLDYSYLVSLSDYARGAEEMVRVKARQVWLFLRSMESALELEKGARLGTFRSLSALGCRMPDPSRLLDSVGLEIQKISRAFGKDFDRRWLDAHWEPLRPAIVNELAAAIQ